MSVPEPRAAIVTGASLGIGRAIALRLARDGADVVLVARDADRLRSVAEEIAALGAGAEAIAASLEDRAMAETIVGRTLERFGRVDVLVNCASATINDDIFALTDEQWALGFEVKLFAALRLCRSAWPALRAARGSIVNIGGIGARTPHAWDAMTGPLSAALMALTKALAERGTADGIQVNMINPGLIRTPRTERLLARGGDANEVEDAMQAAAERLGASRPGSPEDIAALVAFIASPEGRYLHGAIIDQDGGATKGL